MDPTELIRMVCRWNTEFIHTLPETSSDHFLDTPAFPIILTSLHQMLLRLREFYPTHFHPPHSELSE